MEDNSTAPTYDVLFLTHSQYKHYTPLNPERGCDVVDMVYVYIMHVAREVTVG